jgi:hypothetical protein
MDTPKAVRTYNAWFDARSNDEMPPSYQVYISASEIYPSLYNATIVARNVDSPNPKDGEGGWWSRVSQTSLDDLRTTVENELIALNSMKEIHHCDERWVERKRVASS